MSDLNKEYDKALIREAERQRSHELAMAEIKERMETNKLREQRITQQGRRNFIGAILAGLAFLLFIAMIGFFISEDIQRAREACLQADGMWVSGDCVKDTP